MKNEMNLEGYGVENLSLEDQSETDGGFLPYILYTAGTICGAVAWDIVMNWDSAVASVNKGYNQTRNY
jgi:hypothetical protein